MARDASALASERRAFCKTRLWFLQPRGQWVRAASGAVPDLIAAAAADVPGAKWLGLLGIVLASVNIFGGFAVTARMLAMYKKKEKK